MAVKEFKFNGINQAGQSVQGTVFASSKRKAQEKINELSEKHQFRPQSVQQRRIYIYKVRHPNGQIVKGEQKAFSAEELERALKKMGLEVLRVEKKLLAFQGKPPKGDMIMFVRLAANLLHDKLPFDEVLNLLVSDVSSKSLRQVIRDLNADLKGGMDAQQAFLKHQHQIGKFTAYMLGIASKSGNMAQIYESTARFLERRDEFNRAIRQAMITPAITVLVLIGAFVWFMWYIIPETARLFVDMNVTLPPLTMGTLAVADWLDVNWWWLTILIIATVIGGGLFAQSTRGKFIIHRYMIRMPLIGDLLHKLNIEIYCRVFAILYSGAGENIGVIKIASEACNNTYMEHRIKTITVPMMVAQGADLVRAMEASGVFTHMTLARFRSGAETGNVRKSAEQMADYYERETELKLKTVVEGIQTAVAVFITIAICLLTVISSEIALIQPSATDMMNLGG